MRREIERIKTYEVFPLNSIGKGVLWRHKPEQWPCCISFSSSLLSCEMRRGDLLIRGQCSGVRNATWRNHPSAQAAPDLNISASQYLILSSRSTHSSRAGRSLAFGVRSSRWEAGGKTGGMDELFDANYLVRRKQSVICVERCAARMFQGRQLFIREEESDEGIRERHNQAP